MSTTMQTMLEYVEEALDNGEMLARTSNGNLWRCRRNGKTQTWETRPGEFRIPVKAGFHATGEITHRSHIGLRGDGIGPDFIANRIAGGRRFNLTSPLCVDL